MQGRKGRERGDKRRPRGRRGGGAVVGVGRCDGRERGGSTRLVYFRIIINFFHLTSWRRKDASARKV